MLPMLRPSRRSPAPSRSTVPQVASGSALVLALALACTACDSDHHLMADQPPTVTLTSGPVDTVSAPQSWLVDIAWTASDPDGRIDHFEYAVDPPTLKQARFALAETSWVQTRENHVVAHFQAIHRDGRQPGSSASEHHVFVLCAVDDRGGRSPLVVRGFYATTIAPDVQITDPAPSPLLPARVGIPFRLSWQGNDPDGAGTTQPVAYHVRFFRTDSGEYSTFFFTDPDSLLREGEASNWDEWRTVGGDTTSIVASGDEFLPGTRWGAAVVAEDGAGATTPYLTFDRNLLVFDVLHAAGVSVHVFSTYFDYTGPPNSLTFSPPQEVPPGVALTFNMVGTTTAGRHVTGTRWQLDGDLNDETPRSDEATDLAHWSQLHTGVSTASIKLTTGGEHHLAVQAFDDFGDSATLVLRLVTITVSLNRDLLVVDDTRREVDKFGGDGTHATPDPYTDVWPSRTELDTFLFARGGVPWRGTRNPPTGVISAPGLLAGYAFDTLGTRLGLEQPRDAVPLSKLAQYRHVLWLVDDRGAIADGTNPIPVSALRDMSRPGVASTLGAYIALGGQVWLAGGASAYASLINFDRRSNNVGVITVFTVRDGELGPGRPMYDAAHVRSALGVAKSNIAVERSPAAVGGWSGHGPDGTLSAPDYTHLPAALRLRDAAVDPLPPTRLASQAGLYYATTAAMEFVREPNEITEDFQPSGPPRIESALDTLLDVSSRTLGITDAPAMLYYHGRDNEPFVFTGLDLWTWTHDDCQQLVDFVLHDIWGLQKSSPSAGSRAASAVTPPPGPSRSVAARRLDPHGRRP